MSDPVPAPARRRYTGLIGAVLVTVLLALYVGLVEEHGHQIGDRMPASGPHVVDRAIVARSIEVDLTKAPPPPGTPSTPPAPIPRATGTAPPSSPNPQAT